MISHLIVGYPKLNIRNYKWIQSIRKKYDRRYYNIVEPHFTIVFPVYNCSIELLSRHIKVITEKTKAIKFNLKAATIVKDSFSDNTDVFLVTDLGNSEIIKFHDRLYTDIHKKDLRIDIAFIPHISIGGSKFPEELRQLSQKLNSNNFEIKGEIQNISLIKYEHPEVKTVDEFYLK